MALSNLTSADNFTVVETKLDATIDKVNEIDLNIAGGTTDQYLKKTSNTDYDYDWVTISEDATGVIETGSSVVIKTKVMQIGDWDMDSTQTVTVAHLLTASNIRSFHALIYPDGSATTLLPIDFVDITNGFGGSSTLPSGACNIASGNIVLTRAASGSFDNTGFNQTSFNRGWIYINYEE